MFKVAKNIEQNRKCIKYLLINKLCRRLIKMKTPLATANSLSLCTYYSEANSGKPTFSGLIKTRLTVNEYQIRVCFCSQYYSYQIEVASTWD